MNKNLKRVGFVTASVIAVSSVGLAYAAWTSNADGNASAKSFETVQSSITAITPVADLYPGGTGSFQVKVKNLNPYPAAVTSISAGTSNVNGSCAAGSVDSDALTVATPAVLAPNAEGTFTLVSHMDSTATNDCRNMTFTLPLTAVLTTGS